MSLSYPLALPTVTRPRAVTLTPRAVVAYQESPFTLGGQAQVHQGMAWSGNFTLPPMARADAEIWLAWLMSLNGMEGTFLLGAADLHPDYALMGAGGGSPSIVVNGAGQTGRILNLKGLPNGVSGVLKAGDYIGLGSGGTSRLYKVLADVAGGTGTASVDIWPRLRESPSDNAAVELDAPKGVFRLAGNQASWSIDAMRTIETGVSFQEAV